MNKFEELLMLNEKLDAVLSDMNKANMHLENELNAKRNAAQEQMFADIAVLRGYMKKVGMYDVELNTGIDPVNRNMSVAAIKIVTSTTDIGLETKAITNPKDYTFHYWLKKDVPFAKVDYGFNRGYVKDYMFTIMNHWDIAYANMQNDLFNKMHDFMAEKASKVTQKQSKLVNELDNFCRKE